MGLSFFRGRDDLRVAGVGPCHADIFHDGVVKKDNVLKNRTDPGHQFGHLQVEEDQRRLAPGELLAEGCGGVGSDHVTADPGADLLDQLQEVGLVVDRQ